MKETIATIHFIGLCLFTTMAGTDGTLHVVLPRVQSSGVVANATGDSTSALAGVENHTAFLAFKKSDLLKAIDWTPQPLPGQPGYQYIVLRGEAIRFHANAPNAATAGAPAGLPPVESCGTSKLRAGFTAADSSGAAAIVRIPSGTLEACSARPAGSKASARIDTKLRLSNDGDLVVSGETKQDTRMLFLKGNAMLYVANLPSQWVNNAVHQHQHDSPPHELVYPAMLEQTSETACAIEDHRVPPIVFTRCGTVDPAFRFGDAPQQQVAKAPGKSHESHTSDRMDKRSVAAVNSDCSNSSWP